MKQLIIGALMFACCLTILAVVACDKERIVESTEYVKDIEYVEADPDTVWLTDTLLVGDTSSVHSIDTVMIHDTVVQTNTVYDTVETMVHHYDTTVINSVDTVTQMQCNPNEDFAISAMQFYGDSEVLAFINAEFGIADGWVFYLSSFQVDLAESGSGQYDIYGYIDYWTPEWDNFYALEFYWRLNYNGGDPSNPVNWTMTDAPASTGKTPGVTLSPDVNREPSIR